MGNYHVPFWRAVEGVTPSLTLIIRKKYQGYDCPVVGVMASPVGVRFRPHLQSSSSLQKC